jgi:hypothetical protein
MIAWSGRVHPSKTREERLRSAQLARLLAPYGVTALIIAGISGSDAQAQRSIPHGYECGNCQLQVRRVAVLGRGLRHANPVIGSKVARDSSGYYYVAPTSDPEHILVLGPDGRFVGVIGAKGRGPGEFDRVERLAVLGGDSLAVTEVVRVSVFAPDRSLARTLGVTAPITGVFAIPDTSGLLLGYQDRHKPDYPFHIHIGSDTPPVPVGADGPALYDPLTSPRVAALRGHALWVARRNEYVIERFDLKTGERTGRWRRSADWFPSHFTPQEYAESLTRVQAIQPASDSLVWVAVRKRNPQPSVIENTSFERSPSGEIIARRISEEEARDLYDTFVELLDVAHARAITGASFELFGGFLDSSHVYTYREDQLGVVEIHVWELINNRNPRKETP